MPSLIRFLVVCGTLVTFTLGSLYVLAHYFEPEQQEVTKPLRGVAPKTN